MVPALPEHRLRADASATPTLHSTTRDTRRGQCPSQSGAHPAPPQLGSGCPGRVLCWLESEPAGWVLCGPPDGGAACSLRWERQTHTRSSLILRERSADCSGRRPRVVSLRPSAEECPTNRAVAPAATGMDTRRGQQLRESRRVGAPTAAPCAHRIHCHRELTSQPLCCLAGWCLVYR